MNREVIRITSTMGKNSKRPVNAIDDHLVNVNVTAENTTTTKAGKLCRGTFSGNKTTSVLNRDGNSLIL